MLAPAVLYGNSAAASLLLGAGLVKLAAPARLQAALQELHGPGRSIPLWPAYAISSLEIAAGAGLLHAVSRWPAAIAVCVLGTGFVAAGVVGHLRGSTVPCGCLGAPGGRALGAANVLAGLALAVILPLNALAGLPASGGAASTSLAPLLAALGLVTFTLWRHRGQVRQLF